MRPFLYLAGPMSHLPAAQAEGWRKVVADQLRPIHCLSPMRDCDFEDTGDNVIIPTGYRAPLMRDRAALVRNRLDVMRSSAVLANVSGATRISGGTFMEIGWAWLLQKPVVCVMEDGNPHEHAMFLEAVDYRVDRLSDACDIVRSLLDVPTDPPAEEWPAEPINPHAPQAGAEAPYGYCPQCHAPGVLRERRPDGNDTCKKGHVYPSRDALRMAKYSWRTDGDETVTDPNHGGKVYRSLQPERYAEIIARKGGGL